MGGPPEGGSPLGGTPPRGVPPLLSKTDFFEKFEKEDALSRHTRILDPKNPVFGGVPKIDVFGRSLGVLGVSRGYPPYIGRFEKNKSSLICLAATRM